MCKEVNVVTKVLICKSLNHKTVPSCLIVKEGGGGGGGGNGGFKLLQMNQEVPGSNWPDNQPVLEIHQKSL